jgi:hypothetical protein
MLPESRSIRTKSDYEKKIRSYMYLYVPTSDGNLAKRHIFKLREEEKKIEDAHLYWRMMRAGRGLQVDLGD